MINATGRAICRRTHKKHYKVGYYRWLEPRELGKRKGRETGAGKRAMISLSPNAFSQFAGIFAYETL